MLGSVLGEREIRRVGQQGKIAVEEFRPSDGVLIDAPAEPVGLQVGLEEAGQLGFGHGAGDAAAGTAIGVAATTGGPAFILCLQLADHLVGHGLKLGDARMATV